MGCVAANLPELLGSREEVLTKPKRFGIIMARVWGEDGFQVHIWSNDHPPAHVHVSRAEGLVIIDLLTLRMRAAYDMKPADVRRACEMVEEHCDLLLAKWREIHG